MFSEFENIRGSAYGDRLEGDAGDNRIDAGGGSDEILYTAGKDRIDGGGNWSRGDGEEDTLILNGTRGEFRFDEVIESNMLVGITVHRITETVAQATQFENIEWVRFSDGLRLTWEEALLNATGGIQIQKINYSEHRDARPFAHVTFTVDEGLAEPELVGTHPFVIANLTSTETAGLTVYQFDIVGQAGYVFDYETLKSWDFQIQSSPVVGASQQAAVADMTIELENHNEPIKSFYSETHDIALDANPGALAAVLHVVDTDIGDDAHTFRLEAISGPAQAVLDLVVEGNTVKLGSTQDLAAGTYTYKVYTKDAGGLEVDGVWDETGFIPSVLTLTVLPTSLAPSNIAWAEGGYASEHHLPGDAIGRLAAQDEQPGTIEWELVSQGTAPEGSFDIAIDRYTGVVSATGYGLNFEVSTTLELRVRAIDAFGVSTEQDLILTVLDANDSVTVVTSTIQEVGTKSEVGTLVATLTAHDPDVWDNHTFRLEQVDTSVWQPPLNLIIIGNEVRLGENQSINPGEYTFQIYTTDSFGMEVSQTWDGINMQPNQLTFTIRNDNDAPSDIQWIEGGTVSEHAGWGDVVGRLSATDELSQFLQWEIVSGGTLPGSDFELVIDPSSGVVSIQGWNGLDYETASSMTFRARATDIWGASFEQDVTLQIQDMNDPVTQVTSTIEEVGTKSVAGTLIATLTAHDPDVWDNHTFRLEQMDTSVWQPPLNLVVVGNEVRLGENQDISPGEYTFQIYTTDSSGWEQGQTWDGTGIQLNQITFTIRNDNLPPSEIVWAEGGTIKENMDGSEIIGRLTATDEMPQNILWQIVSGGILPEHNFYISVDPITGIVTAQGSALDFETVSTHTLTFKVRAIDMWGSLYEQDMIVEIQDTNDPVTKVNVDVNDIGLLSQTGDLIATLNAEDADVWDSHTFRLEQIIGNGQSTPPLNLQVIGNQVFLGQNLSLSPGEYTFQIYTTDSLGNEVSFTVGSSGFQENRLTFHIQNAPPANLRWQNAVEVPEHSSAGVILGTAIADDEHGDIVWSLVGESDVSPRFLIDSLTGVVSTGPGATSLDFETATSTTITVRAQDHLGAIAITTLEITLADIDEDTIDDSGEDLRISTGTVFLAETALMGQVVTTLGVMGGIPNDTFSFSVSNQPHFGIVGNKLVFLGGTAIAHGNAFDIEITADNGNGTTVSRTLNVPVADVADGFTANFIQTETLYEGQTSQGPFGRIDIQENGSDQEFFELVSGPSFLSIDNLGRLYLDGYVPDFESSGGGFDLQVRVKDDDGISRLVSGRVHIQDVVESWSVSGGSILGYEDSPFQIGNKIHLTGASPVDLATLVIDGLVDGARFSFSNPSGASVSNGPSGISISGTASAIQGVLDSLYLTSGYNSDADMNLNVSLFSNQSLIDSSNVEVEIKGVVDNFYSSQNTYIDLNPGTWSRPGNPQWSFSDNDGSESVYKFRLHVGPADISYEDFGANVYIEYLLHGSDYKIINIEGDESSIINTMNSLELFYTSQLIGSFTYQIYSRESDGIGQGENWGTMWII